MDSQVALQFLAVLVQVSGTILAVFRAINIFILQDRLLAQIFFKFKILMVSFGVNCVLWASVLLSYLWSFFTLNLEEPYSDGSAYGHLFSFIIALATLFLYFARLVWIRRKLYRLKSEPEE